MKEEYLNQDQAVSGGIPARQPEGVERVLDGDS